MAANDLKVAYTPRLKAEYRQTLLPELVSELGLKNPWQAPRLTKIVINVGLGKAKDDKKYLEAAANTLRKDNRTIAS